MARYFFEVIIRGGLSRWGICPESRFLAAKVARNDNHKGHGSGAAEAVPFPNLPNGAAEAAPLQTTRAGQLWYGWSHTL